MYIEYLVKLVVVALGAKIVRNYMGCNEENMILLLKKFILKIIREPSVFPNICSIVIFFLKEVIIHLLYYIVVNNYSLL